MVLNLILNFIFFILYNIFSVSARNNYSSNDNQSLPSSSRSSPPTIQSHHNQTVSASSPRYQTATYTQQTNTTNSRPNVSTSYAAAADKSVPKTQQSSSIRNSNYCY